MSKPTFHLGLCMAGSVSAGAYTAGVIDYLVEALEAWQSAKDGGDTTVPDHQVVIDLMGGASGGGITAALAFFGLHDQITHVRLQADGRSFTEPQNNIFWQTWVNLTGQDMIRSLLHTGDLQPGYVPSLLNASFVDELALAVHRYVESLSRGPYHNPAYVSQASELFMTLFNVTGIKYELTAKAFGAVKQYVAEHRDLAHFRWSDAYQLDGRINLSLHNLEHLSILLQSAKATGAFPGGLKGREVCRDARFIWDHLFFQKNGKFGRHQINLGDQIVDRDQPYYSLHADGGTANNEPVELMRDLLMQVRWHQEAMQQKQPSHSDASPASFHAQAADYAKMSATEQKEKRSELRNYSIILVDPFPAYNFQIELPKEPDVHLVNWARKMVLAMADQLCFDAKDAIDAYDPNKYGLHVIAPSSSKAPKPEYALACGALGGFSGFLHREYRIHDYFLGRHNCQSFLRKYFVVKLNELTQNGDGTETDNYRCIGAVIEGYASDATRKRFAFTAPDGEIWVPIIPDMQQTRPIRYDAATETWDEELPLPLYKMQKPAANFLQGYHNDITQRINKVINNGLNLDGLKELLARAVAGAYDNRLADEVIAMVTDVLKERRLVR